MDIRAMMSIGSLTSSLRNQKPPKPCYCSSRPPNSSDNNNNNNNNKDKSSTDWDKAWSSFKKQGKKSLFSQFKPNKYVSWNPTRSNFPLSEEVDPIKRAERELEYGNRLNFSTKAEIRSKS
nr:transmembrane protein, putative [Tanacetum cinerariifolium]